MPKIKKQLVYEIWQEVFNDDDAFLDLYTQRVYRPNETLLKANWGDESPIVHVGFPSFLFYFRGNFLKTSYISGAATKATARGNGYMQRLLRATHRKMHSRGVLFSFLIPQEPSLYHYYSVKASYFPIGSVRRLTLTERPSFTTPTPELYKRDLDWRKRHLPQPFILHSYQQWLTAYHNASLYGGGAFVSEEHGLLFLEQEKDTWISTIPSSTQQSAVGQVSEPFPYGMARLIHIPLLLQLVAKLNPTLSEAFFLYDKDIPANCGFYRIENGVASFYPQPLEKI